MNEFSSQTAISKHHFIQILATLGKLRGGGVGLGSIAEHIGMVFLAQRGQALALITLVTEIYSFAVKGNRSILFLTD